MAITGAKSEHLPTFLNKLQFITQSEVDLLQHFSIDKVPQKRSYLKNYDYLKSKEVARTWRVTEEKVANFVSNMDVYLLAILNCLLQNSLTLEFQQWQHASQRLLMKKLRSLCGIENVETIYDAFCNHSVCHINIVNQIVQEGLTDPNVV